MPLIGITGGYATGKSLVAKAFGERGAYLIDCDQLAREVVEPGSAGLAEVCAVFGPGVLKEDGSLDRKKLGSVVFADPGKRLSLEAILHPLIREKVFKLAENERKRNPGGVIVVEAAVMYESGLASFMDIKLVVTCAPEQQIERGMARDGVTREEALMRINSQWPLSRKENLADIVINNTGAIESTIRQVDDYWADLTRSM